ncbi:hypothetical protein K435DRAFT_866115 [Dendrothele bispora CBS 962.96]|uniref:Uncharacterized protein n=1 Tax=Dendrothele bispora (strain CBS 962.96) TaxID=1314807 RepID=A0A4V4HDV6_DENBC|nr:hypothetical protein K435DRAFT_866115 [Dendrothele bispora CBS 962.96]
MTFQMLSDGLLSYMSKATYELGTSPLSSWIPLKNYDAAQAYNQHDIAEAMAADEDTLMNKFESVCLYVYTCMECHHRHLEECKAHHLLPHTPA